MFERSVKVVLVSSGSAVPASEPEASVCTAASLQGATAADSFPKVQSLLPNRKISCAGLCMPRVQDVPRRCTLSPPVRVLSLHRWTTRRAYVAALHWPCDVGRPKTSLLPVLTRGVNHLITRAETTSINAERLCRRFGRYLGAAPVIYRGWRDF